MVEEALRKARPQSFVVLDMGLPRNVEHSVNELPNVFLYDVGALNRVVDINLSKRRSEIPRVESLIEEELSRLREWKSSVAVGPMIAVAAFSVREAPVRPMKGITRIAPARRLTWMLRLKIRERPTQPPSIRDPT